MWGGSPATEQIDCGVESSDLHLHSEDEDDGVTHDNTQTNDTPSGGHNSESDMQSNVHKRRKYLDTKLDKYKQEKLKRKLPVDMQLLSCAQEDLEVKRKFVDRMDEIDKKYTDNMEKMAHNIGKLTESISEGFSLLRNMMFQQGTMYPPQVQPPSPYPPYFHAGSQAFTSYPSGDTSSQSWNED